MFYGIQLTDRPVLIKKNATGWHAVSTQALFHTLAGPNLSVARRSHRFLDNPIAPMMPFIYSSTLSPISPIHLFSNVGIL